MAIAIVFPIVAGCTSECNECPDPAGTNAPPFPPVGVFSITGDGQVEICWLDNQENNFVEGYAVYRDDNKDGLYDWIADVDWADLCYTDTDVNNGDTYYYAVLAFDWENRESELSFEDVDDTPRPEGFDVVLRDYLGQSPTTSGWGFESRSVQAWDDITTDIYFGTLTDQQTAGDVSYVFTAAGVDIQDYGYIADEYEFAVFIDEAPTQGWSNLGRVEAVDGHAYIVRVNDPDDARLNNYAKIWVKSVTRDQVTIDWAYQEVPNELELAPGASGGASR